MANKVIVGLDSSGPTLLVSVQNGEKIYSCRHTGIKQEEFVIDQIEKTLSKAGATLRDIGRVCFVRGPGRFTGIRISLTFASMLQALAGADVCSATLFEVLQQQVLQSLSFVKWQQTHPQGKIAVVLHAFREEYFLQIFDETKAAPQWLSAVELRTQLAAYPDPLYVAGTDKDGMSLLSLLGERYRLAPLADCKVRPQTLLALANHPIYEQKALEPLYLKPARFELGQ